MSVKRFWPFVVQSAAKNPPALCALLVSLSPSGEGSEGLVLSFGAGSRSQVAPRRVPSPSV
jgi:hypothetical protein